MVSGLGRQPVVCSPRWPVWSTWAPEGEGLVQGDHRAAMHGVLSVTCDHTHLHTHTCTLTLRLPEPLWFLSSAPSIRHAGHTTCAPDWVPGQGLSALKSWVPRPALPSGQTCQPHSRAPESVCRGWRSGPSGGVAPASSELCDSGASWAQHGPQFFHVGNSSTQGTVEYIL